MTYPSVAQPRRDWLRQAPKDRAASSPQRRIGLTGGIATGKSTVANYLATVHQLPILDADHYAREAVQPGSDIVQRIVERYGPGILADADGHLDRKRLGDIVFAQPEERHWLEAQIHPYVAHCFADTLQALRDQPIVVLMIPLLFEADLTDRVTEIWVVTCSPDQQLARLLGRDHLTPEQAQSRIAAQMPLSEKCDRADLLLHNTGSLDFLQAQIDQALSALQPLS